MDRSECRLIVDFDDFSDLFNDSRKHKQ
jgi:hypothetical protein